MATVTSTTVVTIPRLPAITAGGGRCSVELSALPRRRVSTTGFSTSFRQISVNCVLLNYKSESPRRSSSFQIKASSSEETSVDAGELFEDLKGKWDAVENKSTVILYGGGAIVAIWVSSILVGAINSVPLLPKIMELVGLGYTGWFVYRYLLFKSSRKELATDIESLKKKIAGTE
ncbi:hypothetical protein LguiB_010799 [Lonicera macranthoides]